MLPKDLSNILYTFSKNSGKDFDIATETNTEEQNNEVANMDENGTINNRNILCIIWRNNKLGAAYYSFNENILYIYEEIIDLPPQFPCSRALYREIAPEYILSFGNASDSFIKMLINTITNGDVTVSTTDSLRTLPGNLFLLPSKEYSYDICKMIMYEIQLASHDTKTTKEVFIHSLVNFDNRISLQAAGALVKYLDKNWAYFGPNQAELQILHIHRVSIKNHVLMDDGSLRAFQVFSQRPHDASFKRGLLSSSREGLSLFRLFSGNCKSRLGEICLRRLLLNPIYDVDELNKRLDFITFAQQPVNRDFIESLQDNIKQLADVHSILMKIQNSKASSRDWRVLYKTIYHVIFINELSTPYRDKSVMLNELFQAVSCDLIGLEQSINDCLDFTVANRHTRPVIKFGLDKKLDAKKLRQQDLSKHLSAAAKIAVNELPDFLNECDVVYLPEMGHLVAVKEWEPDCIPDQLQDIGFQYMFTLRDRIHYKNPLCIELDKRIGDITAEIIDHENRILCRLSGYVMKYNKDIREPLKTVALLDCLISMSKIALQNNYTRPELNTNNIHEIEDSRHPLMEIIQPSFEPNSFHSGGQHSRVKIITGPNGSGKSIYLKQIVTIIFLAHIGSYVPAKRANIGMVDSIYSRMQATESASVRLSAFMIDIAQVTQAMNNATSRSFVLLDEFGRGTSGNEGIAFLTAVLKKFLRFENGPPHVLVSTHFQTISQYLPESELVEHLKMEHTIDNGFIYFMFKVCKGMSQSFAFDIAQAVGIDPEVIARGRQLFEALKNNEIITTIGSENYGSEDQEMSYLDD